MPLMLGVDLIYSTSGSIASEQIYGDSGHPCLVSLVWEKFLEIIPDVNTLAIIAEWMNPWNPNLVKSFGNVYPVHSVERLFCI